MTENDIKIILDVTRSLREGIKENHDFSKNMMVFKSWYYSLLNWRDEFEPSRRIKFLMVILLNLPS